MKQENADIVIFGGGIAGLWSFNALKRQGYNALLLESEELGQGQSISSQGIIHSGMKYAFAGHINKLAKSISEMPERWKEALEGNGAVDLQQAKSKVSNQYLLIPSGMMRGVIQLVTSRVLGSHVQTLSHEKWPENIKKSGFEGTVIYMDEPVIDPFSVLSALAEPYKDSIIKIRWPEDVDFELNELGGIQDILIKDYLQVSPRQILFSAARANQDIARKLGHEKGLETQKRPLLMGMGKPAPYKLYAHLVGKSEKPVATITTHEDSNGDLVWYMGGGIAERDKDGDPEEVFRSARKEIEKYLPDTDLSEMFWAAHPVDRVEGKKSNHKKLPDTPVMHSHDNVIYAWPTKWTFAPMLHDKVVKHMLSRSIKPQGKSTQWPETPTPEIARPPWEQKKNWQRI